MLNKAFFLLLICLAPFFASAQRVIKCGTVVPENARKLEERHEKPLLALYQYESIVTCLEKVLSLNFIVVTDSTNDMGVTEQDILDGVDSLNRWFEPICLSFQVCNIDTVYAYKYNEWHKEQEHEEFAALYSKENVINVILVEMIEDPPGANGYAPMGLSVPPPPRFDEIVIAKNGLTGMTFPHEMGHYFGLYHTFETDWDDDNNPDLELVDGSNCQTAGDLLCDTPADIDPAPIGAGCVWNGTDRDPAGDLYTPILGNVMSYHPDNCPGSFTTDQYNRMIFFFLNARNYLY